MTEDFIYQLGFSFELLPQGRYNIKHKQRFVLNESLTCCRKYGFWFRTLEVKSIDDAVASIKTIEILD